MERVVAPAPRQRSLAISLVVVLLGLWSIGFSMFLMDVNFQEEQELLPDNVGIAVFTGGPNRMITGMEILSAGEGQRLLISGVNEATSRDAVLSYLDDPQSLFRCCVDLDYASGNTVQNATHSLEWARENDFEGLVIVTSYYHMPRALLELRQLDHDLAIYPHHVFPEGHQENNWWYPQRFRTLSIEYAKYETALMRIRLANLFD